jgi:YesN/AraC family two-component response regulator
MYKLLIADDENEIRNGLSNYFPWEQVGFEVVATAENGADALDYVLNNHVDAVLCDIKMPVLSGIDFAKELYILKIKTKIIFLSGYKDFEYAQNAIIYGVKNYIVKPSKYSDLMNAFLILKQELDNEIQIGNHINKNYISGTPDISQNYYEKIISTIKSYVDKNFASAKLEDVSELIHMNPFYLSRLFKQKTGQNFSDYVIEKKMEKAIQLLSDIKHTTSEVSEIVGYSSAKNFTRTFKKYFGKSPREYRK